MLKFFRRVRKRLIDQADLRRYLFYAIGEILLVVIGILIALQVNNWSEERKARQFESEILSLIDQNLRADAVQLKEILEYTNRVNSLTDRLIDEVAQKKLRGQPHHLDG